MRFLRGGKGNKGRSWVKEGDRGQKSRPDAVRRYVIMWTET